MSKVGSESNILKTSNYQMKMDRMDDNRSQSTISTKIELNQPRYMNPTIVKLRKHDQDVNEEVIRADALVRRESPSKFSSNSKMMSKS